MKDAINTDSGTMTYIPALIKIGLGIKKADKGDAETNRQQGDCISLLSYFQNKESKLKSCL
jgi:hypothetical protein